MSLTGLATVLIRLYALLLLFHCLQIGQQAFFIKTISGPSPSDSILRVNLISSVSTGILYAVAGICLLVFAKTIARWVAPKTFDRFDVVVSTGDLAVVSFSLAGIYFFIDGVSWFVHDGVTWRLAPKSFGPEVDARMIASLATSAIKVSVGLFLLFGSRGVLRVIRWVQKGTKGEEASEPTIEPSKGPKCPNCGAEYNPANYRQDALEWLCSRCGTALSKE